MPGVDHTVTTDSTSYTGTSDADTLFAAARFDSLYGGGGDDQISAEHALGAAYLSGGGTNTSLASGSDTITGSFSNDTIVSGSAGYDKQSLNPADYDRSLVHAGDGNDSINAYGQDTVHGGYGNDTITSHALSATIFGGQGDDVIKSTESAGHNYISGGYDNDSITVSSTLGADTILGGDGNDTIQFTTHAGAAGELVSGGDGNDIITGNSTGADTIYAGVGNDTVTEHAGNNSFIDGGDGNDSISAGSLLSHGDTVLGGDGNDVIHITNGFADGGGGNDVIYAFHSTVDGGGGNDVIYSIGSTTLNGEGGSLAASPAHGNYLSGGAGDDTLISSAAGLDTLDGGQGSNTLILAPHTSSKGDVIVLGAGGHGAAQALASNAAGGEEDVDKIWGFNFAEDKISFAGQPAGSAQPFTVHMDDAANTSDSSAFASAYSYAFGDGTVAHLAHEGAAGYLAVEETHGGVSSVYLFAPDHAAVVFEGADLASFRPDAIVGG